MPWRTEEFDGTKVHFCDDPLAFRLRNRSRPSDLRCNFGRDSERNGPDANVLFHTERFSRWHLHGCCLRSIERAYRDASWIDDRSGSVDERLRRVFIDQHWRLFVDQL